MGGKYKSRESELLDAAWQAEAALEQSNHRTPPSRNEFVRERTSHARAVVNSYREKYGIFEGYSVPYGDLSDEDAAYLLWQYSTSAMRRAGGNYTEYHEWLTAAISHERSMIKAYRGKTR